MFDRLDDILIRFEELLQELNNPSVVEDQAKFRRLMKEQTELSPVVDAYKAYKQAKQDVEDSGCETQDRRDGAEAEDFAAA